MNIVGFQSDPVHGLEIPDYMFEEVKKVGILPGYIERHPGDIVKINGELFTVTGQTNRYSFLAKVLITLPEKRFNLFFAIPEDSLFWEIQPI